DFIGAYTERLALENLTPDQIRTVWMKDAVFNYETEMWETKRRSLPWTGEDYVLLCPKDLLTRDETWINKHDLLRRFEEIPPAIPDAQLRELVSSYFERMLPRHPRRGPTQKEQAEAARRTILEFPQLIDYYIRAKEQQGDQATSVASE